jgi:lathosterol oxidase
MSDFLSSLPAIWSAILISDLMRYLVGAFGIFLLINLALAGLLTGRKIRPDSPPARQLVTEFFVSLRTVFIFATAGGLLIAAGVAAGWIDLYMDPAERGWLYFWTSVIILIVAHDAWFYWTHRLIHHPRLSGACIAAIIARTIRRPLPPIPLIWPKPSSTPPICH